MSNITMDQVAVMGVQYFHYTLDYYLNSMHRCGVKNLDLWGASPHYCRLDYLTSSAAERKLREIRKKAEDLGLKFVMYTPETLAYPYRVLLNNLFAIEQLITLIWLLMMHLL
mgnify:CR=1 FL=1